MANGVVTIGGQKYAAGLYWQLSPDTKGVAKSARMAAAQPGYQADLYCVRDASKSRSVAQFGLGISESGHKPGMPVAAACLANQQPGSWVGAFNVPEGVWFVVVREDLIDADGDFVFDDQMEAQARLEQEIARGGIIQIYAPSDWGIDASDPSSLSTLLTARRDITLKRVDGQKRNLIAMFTLLLLLALAYGGYSWYQNDQAKKAAIEAARQEEVRRQQQLASGQALAQYKRSWESAPLPDTWLESCENALHKISLTASGWKLGELVCNGTAISLQWSRVMDTIALVPDQAVMDGNLKSATAIFSFIPPQARGAETLSGRDLIDRLALVNQWPVVFQDLPDDVIVVPDNQPPPPPPEWKKRSVVFTLNASPWSQSEIFRVPGLVLTNLKLNNDKWTLEGIFYEKRTP